MKKNKPFRELFYHSLKKILLTMRIAVILMILGILQARANDAYSQKTMVSINFSETELVKVLDKIEVESEFFFLYNEKLLDTDRKVSIDAKDQLISVILDKLFTGTDVKYTIIDRKIILAPGYLTEAPQQKQLSGTVTGKDGSPLPGVNVVITGTTQGTITDIAGKYSIQVPEGSKSLTFSFIGMEPQVINIGTLSQIDLTMAESAIGLDEVVVIGYGTALKRDLTGAIASVPGSEIAERKTTQISQALQGAISGVMVTRNNSAPGATADIRIRGITTIGNSNPLIIVDGVPVDNIDDIKSNDVESITVLKDAASASIYGARAAAGVILVTTKRAKSGQHNLEYNFEYGIQKPTELPEYVDVTRYLEMANEQRWNDNGNNANQYPTFSKDFVENYISNNALNPDLYPITDWTNLIFNKNAPRESHILSFTTGTKTVSTNASISYEKIDALYDFRTFKRITARLNNDITINNYLSAKIDFHFNNSINKQPIVDPVYLTRRMPPQYAAYWSDGRVAGGKLGDNVYGELRYGGFNNNWSNQFGGKISLDFTPLKGFKLSAVLSPNINFNKEKIFSKQIPYYTWNDPTVLEGYLDNARITTLNEIRNDNYNITTQFLANYMVSFGENNLNIMGGYENYYSFYENLGAARNEFELTSFPYLNLGSLEFRNNSGSAYENAYQSYFGRVMYNYANKYFLQTNIRLDGSSRFYKDYRWGLFPSFSAGWVISEENFMKDVSSFISFLKLRGSWGSLGNERIGNYPYQSTIAFSNALLYDQSNNVVSVQTAAQNKYAIKDISWEATQSFDIGVEANFLNNKLHFNGDYYKKTTKDMLLALEIPNYIGFDNPDQNTGKMLTRGWEADLGWNDNVGDFGYSVSFNISDFKSIMGNLGGTEFIGDQIIREGSDYDEWYGYKSEGLFQSQDEVNNSPKTNSSVKPGDVKYTDISGPNGVPDGLISPEYDRVLLGTSLPRYMYGGNIQLLYKGFDLLIVFQGVGKQNARLEEFMVRPLQTQNTAVPRIIDGNYWSNYNTPEQNLIAKYPRLSEIMASNNYDMSDYWLFDGSYFRFKNFTLGYNIPDRLTQKLNIQNIRIYTTISDLFSINKYPQGWDPEVVSTSYPITTSFLFGILIKL